MLERHMKLRIQNLLIDLLCDAVGHDEKLELSRNIFEATWL